MVTLATLKTSATLLAKITKWFASRNDESFRDARDELFREWTTELAVAVRLVEARLSHADNAAETASRLETLSDSHEFWRVLDNYGYEAAREAIDERRRMLAHAAAGSLLTSLTVSQLARVERTIRELDPVDLTVLEKLHSLAPVPTSSAATPIGGAEWMAQQKQRAAERHLWWVEKQPSGHVLAAAGCVLIEDYNLDLKVTGASEVTLPHVIAVVTVTELGRWVLDVTRVYREASP